MKIKEYKDRAIFANEMLDKYFTSTPNLIVSDIGAGFGHMQNKIESLALFLGCVLGILFL